VLCMDGTASIGVSLCKSESGPEDIFRLPLLGSLMSV